MRACCMFLAFFLFQHMPASAAESKIQKAPQAIVTFQDGTVIQVLETQFIYSWVRTGDTRYLNPPITEEKTANFWIEETSHGITAQREIPAKDIEQIDIGLVRPDDTCNMTATAIIKGGVKFTEPSINSVPRDVIKRVPDAAFFSLKLIGVVRSGSERNKFSIKLWGAGVCPEPKDIVKKVTFSSN
jgi:hypothetical protein